MYIMVSSYNIRGIHDTIKTHNDIMLLNNRDPNSITSFSSHL